MRVPALTPLFSDPLAVSGMTITPGGNIVLTTAAPHQVTIGSRIAIAITDADTPNPFSAAVVLADGNIRFTTTYAQDFTTAPAAWEGEPWDSFVTITGFANALINGSRQLVEAPDSHTLIVKPGGPVVSAPLTAQSAVLERLPGSVIGWHSVLSASSTTLTFPAAADVTRALSVTAPVVVRNIRCWGALDINTARRKFVSADEQIDVSACHLFVVPVASVKTSRSRNAKTDALAEVSPAVELRQLLVDGFTALVFCPAKSSSGAVAASDLCQGPLFKAMMRTFNGLRLPRPELAHGSSYAALLASHGAIYFDGATYVHAYEFQAPAYITNADAIMPFEQAELSGATDGIDGYTPPTDVPAVGAPAFRDIDFTGILHDGAPQPLTGVFTLEPS